MLLEEKRGLLTCAIASACVEGAPESENRSSHAIKDGRGGVGSSLINPVAQLDGYGVVSFRFRKKD